MGISLVGRFWSVPRLRGRGEEGEMVSQRISVGCALRRDLLVNVRSVESVLTSRTHNRA